MVKIILEIADNGIIKTITDDNSNGAGSILETKTVYDLSDDEQHAAKIKFLYELSDDLGLDTGNKFSKNNLVMKLDWGKSYEPTENEIKAKIKRNLLEVESLQLFLNEDESVKNIDEKN